MHTAGAARAMHEISSPGARQRALIVGPSVDSHNLGGKGTGVSPSELPNEGTTLKLDINRELPTGYSISGRVVSFPKTFGRGWNINEYSY